MLQFYSLIRNTSYAEKMTYTSQEYVYRESVKKKTTPSHH